MDNVLIIEDAISRDNCDALIKKYSQNLDSSLLDTYHGYSFVDIYGYNDHPILRKFVENSTSQYQKICPAINMTCDKWLADVPRFKHFPKGYSFSEWHCEHSVRNCFRIASLMVYLTDHDCGTEFYSTGDVIKSKAGRAVLFPASWTHTHRGQICPEGKDRYIVTSYISVFKETDS